MKTILLVLCIFLPGCGVSMFTAKTTASYEVTADGKRLNYESNKEQQGLDAEYNPKTGAFKVHVDKAGTPDAAIAAALQSNVMMIDLMSKLLPILEKAAAAGGK